MTASNTVHPEDHASEAVNDGAPIAETRVWPQEHEWLYGLLKSDQNTSPSFRFPDLISACVSLLLARKHFEQILFSYLGLELVLRERPPQVRKESMWRAQYEQLQDLQRSPFNQHPNPKFQLDQLTTACVALARIADASGQEVLQQARRNMALRAQQHRPRMAALSGVNQ